MHELFLTTSIRGEDCSKATRILQGYCAMSPSPLLRRRLIWKGPLNRKEYKSFDAVFIVNQGNKTPFWRSLGEQIMRQAYVITLIYDIKKDQFPKDGDTTLEEKPVYDCDDLPGSLQWNELPDPGARPVNSRTSIVIEGEKKLVKTLHSINYRFALELVEEGYRFVHGNVVIYLTRFLAIPPEAQEMESEGKPKVNHVMPPYEDLSLFDGDDKWILMAKVDVWSGSDPEQMKRATEELLAVKTDFEGLFDLEVKDRLIFDTRVKS